MTSSKKKRGKQRKAAKNLAAANNISDATTPVVDRIYISSGNTTINLSSSQLVALVKKGNKTATEALILSLDKKTDMSFEINAVLPSVLGFLQKCEHETFGKVIVGIGGDLSSPSTWIRLLLRTSMSKPSCCMQIAENIGPVVRCMCNDSKRLFFKSNKHWRESIVSFVGLIASMVPNDDASPVEKRNIIDTLLQYEDFLRSIVQWGFWGEEHRPDIVKELGVEECTLIAVNLGRRITARLVLEEAELIEECLGEEEAKGRLEAIGTAPIVSKEYNPNCMISYVAGMIRIMQTTGDKGYFTVLMCFIGDIDCVDKDVISEVIDFGFNFTTDYDTAEFIAAVSCNMLLRVIKIDDTRQQCDTRIAFAIKAGLVEMCLSVIERFWGHESFGDEQSLFDHDIRDTLESVYKISLHQKTAKAIGQKKKNIEKELACLENIAGISSNDKCKELLDMVRSILYLHGAYCCRCNKSLGKKEVKRCDGCNRMTYCSVDCQKEDWLDGHNLACCKNHIDEEAGQFQGRILPVAVSNNERNAAKLGALEQNVHMIQLKLFLDNSETILSQASSLGIPLSDCAVRFDLRECPPSVETKKYTEYCDSPEEIKSFEDMRSKENITCIYISCICHGYMDEDGNHPMLVMQKFFPHEWLSTKKSQE